MSIINRESQDDIISFSCSAQLIFICLCIELITGYKTKDHLGMPVRGLLMLRGFSSSKCNYLRALGTSTVRKEGSSKVLQPMTDTSKNVVQFRTIPYFSAQNNGKIL